MVVPCLTWGGEGLGVSKQMAARERAPAHRPSRLGVRRDDERGAVLPIG